MAKNDELNPRLEALRVEDAARKAERKRLAAFAATVKVRGPVPPAVKGRTRYVASEDTVTPEGRHFRHGHVFSVPSDVEPSLTWDNYEERLEREKKAKGKS